MSSLRAEYGRGWISLLGPILSFDVCQELQSENRGRWAHSRTRKVCRYRYTVYHYSPSHESKIDDSRDQLLRWHDFEVAQLVGEVEEEMRGEVRSLQGVALGQGQGTGSSTAKE